MPEHETHLLKKHFAMLTEMIHATREPDVFIARVEDAMDILHLLEPTARFSFLTRSQRALLARVDGELLPAAHMLREHLHTHASEQRVGQRVERLQHASRALRHTALGQRAVEELRRMALAR